MGVEDTRLFVPVHSETKAAYLVELRGIVGKGEDKREQPVMAIPVLTGLDTTHAYIQAELTGEDVECMQVDLLPHTLGLVADEQADDPPDDSDPYGVPGPEESSADAVVPDAAEPKEG